MVLVQPHLLKIYANGVVLETCWFSNIIIFCQNRLWMKRTWFIAKRNTLVAKKMSSWKLQWLQISFATWYRHQYKFASRSLLLEKIRRQLKPAKSFCFDLRHAKCFLPSAASRENMLRWDASSNFFRIELRAANFFRIGLHSAKKLLLVSAMRENSRLRLLPAEIFSLSASPLAQDDADSEKFSRTASTGELNFTELFLFPDTSCDTFKRKDC